MKPIKQTVYLPVNNEWDVFINDYTLMDIDGEYIKNITKKEGYFFTPEQLNEYTRNVGKAFLDTAAENVEPDYWKGSCELCGSNVVDKESITNTFELTAKQFEV